MAAPDHFKVLGVDAKANDEAIKKAYRKLAKKFHPDKNKQSGAEERFKEIANAYNTLTDPLKRRDWEHEKSAEELKRSPRERSTSCPTFNSSNYQTKSYQRSNSTKEPRDRASGRSRFSFSSGGGPQGFRFETDPTGSGFHFSCDGDKFSFKTSFNIFDEDERQERKPKFSADAGDEDGRSARRERCKRSQSFQDRPQWENSWNGTEKPSQGFTPKFSFVYEEPEPEPFAPFEDVFGSFFEGKEEKPQRKQPPKYSRSNTFAYGDDRKENKGQDKTDDTSDSYQTRGKTSEEPGESKSEKSSTQEEKTSAKPEFTFDSKADRDHPTDSGHDHSTSSHFHRSSENSHSYRDRESPSKPKDEPGSPGYKVPCAYCGRKYHPSCLNAHEKGCSRWRKPGAWRAEEVPRFNKGGENSDFDSILNNLRKAHLASGHARDAAHVEDIASGRTPAAATPLFRPEDADLVYCAWCQRSFSKTAARGHVPACKREAQARGGRPGAPDDTARPDYGAASYSSARRPPTRSATINLSDFTKSQPEYFTYKKVYNTTSYPGYSYQPTYVPRVRRISPPRTRTSTRRTSSLI